jgi:hypothetical protein
MQQQPKIVNLLYESSWLEVKIKRQDNAVNLRRNKTQLQYSIVKLCYMKKM